MKGKNSRGLAQKSHGVGFFEMEKFERKIRRCLLENFWHIFENFLEYFLKFIRIIFGNLWEIFWIIFLIFSIFGIYWEIV